MKIAGHTFPPFHDRCACGKNLLDLMPITRDDIGKSDIAHIGLLNETEYDEIEAYRCRLVEGGRS